VALSLSANALEARSLPIMADKPKPTVRDWTVEQKARVLAETCKLDGEELTAYLEREGVKLAEYEQWRMALKEGEAASASTNKRIRQLERELARANPERWNGSTRNWLPVELVVLNPERAPHQVAA
jgi:hypothetical protein